MIIAKNPLPADAEEKIKQPPRRIDIGDFFIMKGMRDGRIWIGRQDGEGGDFDIKAVEKVIGEFYEENF